MPEPAPLASPPGPPAEAHAAELAALRQELRQAQAELARLAPAPAAPQPDAAPEAPPVPLPRLGGLRPRLRAAMVGAYRLVRPVARPLAHRGRTFLTAQLQSEMADMRERHEAVMARLDALQASLEASQAEMAQAAERVLLTLALEPRPPGG